MNTKTIVIIIVIVLIIFAALFLIAAFQVIRFRQKVYQELSFKSGIFKGPAGDPYWTGKLPPYVCDYVEPRYVYENLVETTDYLPENGRIIGYRISPRLVIHSRVQFDVNPLMLMPYIHRFQGKLLESEDIPLLNENWEKISELRQKAGDTPLNKFKQFWMFHEGMPVAFYSDKLIYKDDLRFVNVFHPLILKR